MFESKWNIRILHKDVIYVKYQKEDKDEDSITAISVIMFENNILQNARQEMYFEPLINWQYLFYMILC